MSRTSTAECWPTSTTKIALMLATSCLSSTPTFICKTTFSQKQTRFTCRFCLRCAYHFRQLLGGFRALFTVPIYVLARQSKEFGRKIIDWNTAIICRPALVFVRMFGIAGFRGSPRYKVVVPPVFLEFLQYRLTTIRCFRYLYWNYWWRKFSCTLSAVRCICIPMKYAIRCMGRLDWQFRVFNMAL